MNFSASQILIRLQNITISQMRSQNLSNLIRIFCIIFLHFVKVDCYLVANPKWVTSTFFRANNQNVINSLTGNTATPQYKFIYSSALPGVPNLAYGVKNYRGNDYFGQQTFQIRRVELTNTYFRVAVQIYGPTNIWILNVPYIAIDPQFPHHLNSFDNVPVNYGSGNLVNLTSKSTTQLHTYTNVVNYTQQAAGLKYTKFKSPISNNKILFYIMAIDIKSTNEGNGVTWYPIDFHIRLTILTENTYEIFVSLETNVQIDQLHLSQIMYDVADVESSKKYYIISQYYDLPKEGGFIPIPIQFVDNFIMGLTDFSTVRGQSVLNYNWEFETVDGIFGARVNQSIPINITKLSIYALNRQGTMVFYIKTWQCPLGYDFFNLTTNLCQDMCGDYHFENNSIYQCQYCNYSCLDCTSGHDCLACSGGNDYRILTGQKACQCLPGYFQTKESTQCRLCQQILPHCLDCFYNNTYNSSDSNSVHFGCFACDNTTFLQNLQCKPLVVCAEGTFLNLETNQCQICYIDGCTICESLSQCKICDASINKYLNTQTKLCESCTTSFCVTCSSMTTCTQCKQSFILLYNYCVCPEYHYFDKDDELCKPCSPYCKTCNGMTPYNCLSCFYEQHRRLIGSFCACDDYNYQQPDPNSNTLVCVKESNEKCDRGFIYIIKEDTCIELCGDGVLIQNQCDDGNIQNGDGCSDMCKIENKFICSQEIGQMSVCRLSGTIQIDQMVIQKDPSSNSLKVIIDLNPQTSIYDDYDFAKMLEFKGADIDITQAYIQNGKLILKANYHEDLTDKPVSLQIKEEYYFDPSISHYPETIFTTKKAPFNFSSPKSINYIEVQEKQKNSEQFIIVTKNNLDPYYFTEEQYSTYEYASRMAIASTALGLVTAGLTLFLKNSLPTLMIISTIQIDFIGLSAVEGFNPVSVALVDSKPILGYNPDLLNDSTDKFVDNQLENKVSALGFNQSILSNFNIMLLCCIGMLSLNVFFYMASFKKHSMKIAFKLMQRQTMLFILFNSTNAYFSLSIVKQITLIGSIVISVTILIYVYQIFHFFFRAKHYFGMENTLDFKKSYVKLFLFVFVAERIIVCLCLGFTEDSKYVSIAAMACQCVFVIFLTILRPFVLLVNNILVIIGELLGVSFFVVLITMDGYKDHEWINAWAMVGIILATAFVGFLNLSYSFYKDFCPKKQQNSVSNNNNIQAEKNI